jgi:uncharacterized protein
MRINPEMTPLTREYWDGLREGRLMLQRCAVCRGVWHPPEPVCPWCQSSAVEWFPASGRGHLYSYTWVHHATHEVFRDDLPYLVVLVDLEEGPRLVSTIQGQGVGPLLIGAELRATFPGSGDPDDGLVMFEFADAEHRQDVGGSL